MHTLVVICTNIPGDPVPIFTSTIFPSFLQTFGQFVAYSFSRTLVPCDFFVGQSAALCPRSGGFFLYLPRPPNLVRGRFRTLTGHISNWKVSIKIPQIQNS